jgi:endonuclease YncB( thermonuclease family)
LLAILLPRLACAETVEGTARIIDGDTIEIKDQKIRLWGIDAPELAQRCTEDDVLYPCGLDASHALARRIGRKLVSCTRRDTDRYGRMVALCRVEDLDISQWMVTQGQAIAFRKYSLDYVAEEDQAREAKVGIWAGEFQDPSDFRHQKHRGHAPEQRLAAYVRARMMWTKPAGDAESAALISGQAAERRCVRRAD